MSAKTTLFLPAYIFSVVSFAQPAVSNNEYYHIGDVIQMVNCDPTGISAGSGGAAITWDFTALTPSGGMSTTTVLHDTSTVFLTSNLLIVLPDGTYAYEQENSTDSYINGIYDPATHNTISYTNYDIAKRPVNYLTNYIDSYKVDNPATSTVGTGHLVQSADAYGTLKLPNGTFNVLRIKKNQFEQDTTAGNPVSTTTVSYLWFDGVHSAPLFRLDSVIGIIGSGQKAMYLSIPAGFSNVYSATGNYNAYFSNDDLLLSGTFSSGASYEVVLYNIIGRKVFSQEFAGAANIQRFNVGKQINPGIYIVVIVQKNDPSFKEEMKVIKN